MKHVRQVQQALVYLAALHSGDPQRERQAAAEIAQWRERSASHEQAWQDARMRWQMVHGLGDALREQLSPSPPPISRRALLQRSGALLGVLAVAGWAGLSWRREVFDRQLITGHGQTPSPVTLADGTRLILAAESNLQVSYGLTQRSVFLVHGNVYFDVAHERLRRFVIRTRLGEVEVIGTAFSVSDRGFGVRVEVSRGRVKVRSSHGVERLLGAGQALTLDSTGQPGQIEPTVAAADALEQWQQGWWMFTNKSLPEVIAELNAYLDQEVFCDPALSGMRFTGSFPGDQPRQVLDTITRVLPVRLTLGDGQQRLIAR
ncbi:FecR domain-containing protein [Pseudomonas sp. JDS28PS106]|uniref:FecR family protein n=1 Tax=Pseudomonas sp. JDS28PS106 TaxID=2497235 RepID=UPI002FD4C464